MRGCVPGVVGGDGDALVGHFDGFDFGTTASLRIEEEGLAIDGDGVGAVELLDEGVHQPH